jgi:autotransporter-associated beta strand protein
MTYVEAGTLTLGATNTLIMSQGVDLGRVGGGAIATLALGADQTLAMINAETSNTASVTLGGHTLTLGETGGVNPNASFTFGGVIGDGATPDGSLVKAGTGSVVLTGANTYTGSTTVNGGTLEVDGSLASSSVIVNANGTLSGSGTIGDPIINAGGTLAPGMAAAIGTLTVNGSSTFQSGSNYNVRVTPTSNDSTIVNGTTMINGGTVNALFASGVYQPSATYTLLTATGGVTGTFAALTTNFASAAGNLPFLTPSLGYDADDVYLNITPNYNFASAALTRNQLAVATALAAAGPKSPNAPIMIAFDELTGAAQAQAAFDNISGEGITAANTAALRMSGMFTDTMNDQSTLWLDGGHAGNEMVLTEPAPGALSYAPAAKMKTPIAVRDPALPPVRTWRAWASGFGADETVHGDADIGSAAQSLSYYGGAMGVDYQINPNLLFGIAGSGSNGSFSVSQRSTYGSVTGGQVGTYGVATFGSYYLASSTSIGFFHNSETRLLSGFSGLAGETDHGGFDSIAVRTRLEAGRRLAELYGAVVTPYVALEIANLRSNGFNEAPTMGAGIFALNMQGQQTASVPASVGLRFEKLYDLNDGMTFKPILSLAYGHDFASQRVITNTLLGLSGSPFEISGAQVARDFALTKAGFELALTPSVVAFVNFDGNFSNRDQLYGGKGGMRLTW